jgi:FlaA1/EpsC-like NDP-sugar epimerase
LFSDFVSGVSGLIITGVFTEMKGMWHVALVVSFTALATLMLRFLYRLFYQYINKNASELETHKIPVAIVGAGQLGALLAEELNYNKRSNYKPMFFIDRDKSKAGGRVAGLRVYLESEKIIEFIREQAVSEIFVAINNLDNETSRQIYDFYKRTSCKIKLYDTSINGYYSGDSGTRRTVREFQIEDLLFRKTLNINDTETVNYYSGKTVLVTGGRGSIGSEICRQVAKCSPKKLIVLDIYENNAYDIQQELTRKYGKNLDLAVEIASVRDKLRLDCIFDHYRPDVVFHAAAHKHVPLMEHSGCEAIKNNVFGTYNTANAAEKYGAEKFILISTDKAVNPTNIMGASKRMCEMVVQCRKDSKTSFAAVRFGNVLGSNGSVIPLFKRQIAAGGPVTITDKRIIRYFMTIPEASQLVMQAGAMARSGELFVLDMGDPVKIYDLAVNMIKLSGYEPGVDIEIEEIGLRPGEKLYEELLIKTEELDKTKNNMIFIERDEPLSREAVEEKLKLLDEAVKRSEGVIASPEIKVAMKKAVPTFRDPGAVNKRAWEAEEMKLVENK